jgi:hypothetical protein
MDDTSTDMTEADEARSPEDEAARLQRERDALREREAERALEDHPDAHVSEPRSGEDEAVDHDRQPGVPPPHVDDYEDIVDKEGAESFPASDPPGSY